MSAAKVYRFGPGALEAIRLEVYQRRRANTSLARVVRAKATGTFTVYCGAGWSHQVDIESVLDVQRDYAQDYIDKSVVAALDGNHIAAQAVADQLVEYALEEWSDPCPSAAAG